MNENCDSIEPGNRTKYAYVLNNPLRYTDPSGHCAEDACIVEGTAAVGTALYVGGAALLAGTWAVLNTPSGQRSLDTFTSAAGASISNSITNIKSFFAKDGDAGQLQKGGRDAIDQANKTMEKASQDIAKFKNPADVQQHIDAQKKGIDTVKGLIKNLDTAKGKARDQIKDDLKTETDKLKGHDKDIRQMPKKPDGQ